MSIGCGYDEFWDSGYEKLGCYLKKAELELERENFLLWLNGHYLMQAYHPKGKGKNAKLDYPKQPIRLKPMTQEEQDEQLACNLAALVKRLDKMADNEVKKETR